MIGNDDAGETNQQSAFFTIDDFIPKTPPIPSENANTATKKGLSVPHAAIWQRQIMVPFPNGI